MGSDSHKTHETYTVAPADPGDDLDVPRGADAQEDVSALLIELLGNLRARLRTADNEHRTRRQ